ncbi:MAG: hypothetical protein UEU47_00675 [Oscillospiraceae bacterium]|nr:hypothetical protein [Oscillospiraceae bacterium]
MKKNKIMRLASALLVLTLMTTCAISSTFAKYTTSTTGGDKARVAYWGFDQGASTTIDLFKTNYQNVKSANTDDVVAPGTSGSAPFAFGYTNNTDKNIKAPEVAYDFTVNVTTNAEPTDYKALDDNKDFTWTLTKKSGKDTTTVGTYQTVAELTGAIKALSGDSTGTKRYEAGKLPDAFTSADETYTIGWNWAFEGDNNYTTPNPAKTQDQYDTAMGNAQTLDNVNLTITITATQVD